MSRVFENYYTPSCKITSYPGLYEDRRPPHLQVEAVLSPTSEILLDHNTTVSQLVGSKFLQICHLQLETKSHNTASERLHQRVVRLVPRPTDIFLRARLSQLEMQTSQAVSSAKRIANLSIKQVPTTETKGAWNGRKRKQFVWLNHRNAFRDKSFWK